MFGIGVPDHMDDLVRNPGTTPTIQESAEEPMVRLGQGDPPSGTQRDFYRAAEEELSRLAVMVRQGDCIHIERLNGLAADIVDALQHDDFHVVEALSGPAGSPLVTNLINVAVLATKLGMGLGYRPDELERVALAGLLHDIGIFAIPESLLMKSERLTPDERQLIEQHPELGADLITQLGPPYGWLATVIRQAHERWSGQGYPNGLRGTQIHDYARIIGIVDVLDALVSPRPYRPRILPEDAVRELIANQNTAFSRELVKAVVQHLSVYPLGTMVRLNTGDLAVVIQLNPKYPLRPTVHFVGSGDQRSSGGPQVVDLSKNPLVSVLETVEPPAPGRVPSLQPAPSVAPKASEELPSSEQFSTVLESLDAIACLIEQAVERNTGTSIPAHPDTTASEPPTEDTTDLEFGDAEFHQEVLELFTLEAQEWMHQIRAALNELEAGPATDLRRKLLDIIVRGITNLGGSAATVALPNIKRLAFGLLPPLHTMREKEAPLTPDEIASLKESLVRISAMVEEVGIPPPGHPGGEGQEDGETPEPEPPATFTASQEHAPSGSTFHEHNTVTPTSEPSHSLLEGLRELQRVRKESLESTRNVIEFIVQRVEKELRPENRQLDHHTLLRFIEEHEEHDTQFLAEVERRVPDMARLVSELKGGNPSSVVSDETLEPILRAVQGLQEIARTVAATPIILFLNGLQAFLKVVTHRKVSLAAQRLEAVEMRLAALRPMAQQWVEVGRVERAAIRQVLPT